MGLSATVTASTVAAPRIEVVKARDKSKMACRASSLGSCRGRLHGRAARRTGPLRHRGPREAVRREAAAALTVRRQLPPTCPRWTRCPPTSPPADPSTARRGGKAGAELSGAVLQVANPQEPKWDSNAIRSRRRTDRYFRGKSPTEAGRIGAGEQCV
jgi:hypothetical protein